MSPAAAAFAATLARDAPDYGVTLDSEMLDALTRYYNILHRWNPRLHLVAPCAPDEFARRHVLESLFAASHLPPNASLVDVGSGGGLPALPLLITRADLRLTLVEANRKKAVFLREALTETGCANRGEVFNARFENINAPDASALTCRALDRFTQLLPQLLAWASNINLLLLYGGEDLRGQLPQESFEIDARLLPRSEGRFLYVLSRQT